MANCNCPPTVEDQEYEIYKTLNTVAQNAEFFTSACWKNLSDDQKLCLVTRSFIDVVDSVGGVGPIGPQGPEGPVGEAGPAGPQGLAGPRGIRGTQGIEGNEGPSVDFQGAVANEAALPTPSTAGYCYFVESESAYYVYNGSAWIGYGPLQGQPGPAGPQGPAGATGAAGPQGPQGATGAVGPTGPTGIQGVSGGFDASNIILAKVGDNLITKYSQAVALATAIGANATNRVALVIMPGNYTVDPPNFSAYQNFVDIIGLGSSPLNPKVFINYKLGEYTSFNGMGITASDVRIVGIHINSGQNSFNITNPTANQYFQNCSTGQYFGLMNTSGTFVNCSCAYGFSHAASSIPGTPNASGIYINCKCINGFGFGSTSSINQNTGYASGTFIECKASNIGFAGSNTGSSVIFGGTPSNASGIFINCEAGKFATERFSGLAKNCIGGTGSFGTNNIYVNNPITGKIIKCRKTSGSYGSLGVGGQIRFSLDGSNNIVNLG